MSTERRCSPTCHFRDFINVTGQHLRRNRTVVRIGPKRMRFLLASAASTAKGFNDMASSFWIDCELIHEAYSCIMTGPKPDTTDRLDRTILWLLRHFVSRLMSNICVLVHHLSECRREACFALDGKVAVGAPDCLVKPHPPPCSTCHNGCRSSIFRIRPARTVGRLRRFQLAALHGGRTLPEFQPLCAGSLAHATRRQNRRLTHLSANGRGTNFELFWLSGPASWPAFDEALGKVGAVCDRILPDIDALHVRSSSLARPRTAPL